jgi:hypothetical protein
MESVYHIVTIFVNKTSWAHVWRLRSRYLGTGYDSGPGLAGSPGPRRGGLQSPNRTVTSVGTTLPCKAWSFTEGFKPRHHVRE